MIQRWRAFKLLRYALLAVAVSILFYMISKVGFGQIVQHLSTMHPGWLLLTFVFMAANICFATLRFRCLIMSNLSFGYFLEVFLASFLLNYAAMVQGLGLGAKMGMLKTRQVPISHSSAGIWLEICLDILVCSSIIAIFLFIQIGPGIESMIVFAIPLMIVAAASLSLLVVRRFPGRIELADQFLTAFREVSSVPRLSLALLYTIGIWISTGVGLYCILNAFQAGASTDLGLSILAMTSGFLTGLVSLVPGGIGVRELTWSYVVSQGGYPLELASLAAILYRISAIFLVSVTLAIMTFTKRKAA
jgi:uncharacterized membrane protein YbhN (UPF0104 family)